MKSSLLRSIALRDEWFSDSLPHNLADKDARGHLPGKLIVEMSDISQFKKSQTETVKSFLSCQTDRFRPPDGRHDIEWQRRNVFVGTTNDDTYLADSTGNRRFWPLKITKIRLKEARKVIEQVYAEAVQAYRNGEQWWLTEEIEPIAVKEQDARRHVDPWEEKAGEFLKSGTHPLWGRQKCDHGRSPGISPNRSRQTYEGRRDASWRRTPSARLQAPGHLARWQASKGLFTPREAKGALRMNSYHLLPHSLPPPYHLKALKYFTSYHLTAFFTPKHRNARVVVFRRGRKGGKRW